MKAGAHIFSSLVSSPTTLESEDILCCFLLRFTFSVVDTKRLPLERLSSLSFTTSISKIVSHFFVVERFFLQRFSVVALHKKHSTIENTSTMNTAECLKTWIDQAAINPKPTTGRARAVSDSTSDRPSVQTDNTYDDDESFTMASLNLLSKQEYLSLSPRDAINSTLVFPLERSMYLEALYVRKTRVGHLSPSTASLILNVEKIFGVELRRIVERESCTMIPFHGANNRFFHMSTTNRPPSTPCREKNRRSFCFGESAFFGGCKNLDWKLTEAIEQVQSLRLDGSPAAPPSATYTPPPQLGRLPF